jgi:hypothetical protein
MDIPLVIRGVSSLEEALDLCERRHYSGVLPDLTTD